MGYCKVSPVYILIKGCILEVMGVLYAYVLLLLTDFPPEVVDAGKGLSAEVVKKKVEEATLVIKTTYWYLNLLPTVYFQQWSPYSVIVCLYIVYCI